ncbi:MAG: hypothetical protein E7027_06515 [Elusimicrobium sp.]|uniref:Peptidase S8/S53 domain-containing protein n=1 Tax=Candidatus Avelusimicrobium gallicola TaxID=2562704 RepID=A0A928DQT4_9BACT|nr:hypothetical protein [Elusimicrobium sp.]
MRVSEDGEFSWIDVTPEPEAFDNLWAYRLFPAEKKLTGKGVTVAVADSGIMSHPEFNGKNIQGQDFTMSGFITDIKNHGTGVAGVIGARGLRFTGIAPNAAILVYKIDDGSRLVGPQASASALNAIFDYNQQNPNQKIAVVNLSYGASGGGSVPLTNAINRLHDSGVVIVCPAGNDGFPGVHYPAIWIPLWQSVLWRAINAMYIPTPPSARNLTLLLPGIVCTPLLMTAATL